jgi:hypothetical protein
MAARGQRLGAKEALFREVNERIVEVAEQLLEPGDESQPIEFVCECGNASCGEQIELSVEEYERVRAQPARFAVAPGHELPEIERIVERHSRYVVIEKHDPDAEEVAIETDPRGDNA